MTTSNQYQYTKLQVFEQFQGSLYRSQVPHLAIHGTHQQVDPNEDPLTSGCHGSGPQRIHQHMGSTIDVQLKLENFILGINIDGHIFIGVLSMLWRKQDNESVGVKLDVFFWHGLRAHKVRVCSTQKSLRLTFIILSQCNNTLLGNQVELKYTACSHMALDVISEIIF